MKVARFLFSLTLLLSGKAFAGVSETWHTCERVDHVYGYNRSSDIDGSLSSIFADRVREAQSANVSVYQNFVLNGLEVLYFGSETYRRPIPYGNYFYNESFANDIIVQFRLGGPLYDFILVRFNVGTYSDLKDVFLEGEFWQCTLDEKTEETPALALRAYQLGLARNQAYEKFIAELADIGDGCPVNLNGTFNNFDC